MNLEDNLHNQCDAQSKLENASSSVENLKSVCGSLHLSFEIVKEYNTSVYQAGRVLLFTKNIP